ncbi:MAG: Heat shock protein 70, partial [Rhodoferax sp.]|nr:Heat shock protein 70 [Rhodoferax sp.]
LPQGSEQERSVDVRFTYDVNGLLQVEATVLATQQTVSLVIEGNPGLLSDAQIRERLEGLRDLKIHPRERTENRTVLARAERVYQMLLGETREWMAQCIVGFEVALASQDTQLIAPAMQLLREQLQQVELDSPLAG